MKKKNATNENAKMENNNIIHCKCDKKKGPRQRRLSFSDTELDEGGRLPGLQPKIGPINNRKSIKKTVLAYILHSLF